jgi:hypothetical protein
MRPQGISPHHIGVVLQRDSRRMALLNVAPNCARAAQGPGQIRGPALVAQHRANELAAVFAKTGTRRQSALVALILGALGAAARGHRAP